ncbi:MAG: glycosyltransferase family 2 protein, partial [Bacteroidetes bacterium]|nr:glycosyltransferase family 2 protein [Bacteroidota bacterium]
MSRLSVIIITKNESSNIEECLRSVSFSDDIVVVDAESTDDTVLKARNLGATVIVRPWQGYAAAKQFALEQTKHDWVLWLDADERVMPALAREIPEVIGASPVHAAFTVARRAYFLGRWIRHSGWYPGRVARLFRKQHARFNDAAVHEGLEIVGTVGELKNDLLHYTDPNLYHYLSKFNRYTTLATEGLEKKGKRFSTADLLVRPWWLFLKMYILRRGFLDGIQGLLLAILSSAYVFTKYAKLWE